jgi:hypothetical protein
MPLADLLAWDPMAAALAAQRPVWDPGTAHGYHGRSSARCWPRSPIPNR